MNRPELFIAFECIITAFAISIPASKLRMTGVPIIFGSSRRPSYVSGSQSSTKVSFFGNRTSPRIVRARYNFLIHKFRFEEYRDRRKDRYTAINFSLVDRQY